MLLLPCFLSLCFSVGPLQGGLVVSPKSREAATTNPPEEPGTKPPTKPATKPSLYPVGTAILRFRNPTKEGAKRLSFFFVYPATKRGKHSPIAKGVWKSPALVFLHGLGGTGRGPEGIARYLAARGYMVFLLDGSRFDPEGQVRDARASYRVLVEQNGKKGSLLYERLDPKRIALGGHSMGGGTTLRVLADNPGYCAGVLVAPWNGINAFSPKDPSPKVKVPTLVVTGDSDRVLSWKKYAATIFRNLGVGKGEGIFALVRGTGHLKIIFPNRFPFYVYRANGAAVKTTFPLVKAFLDRVLRGRGEEMARILEKKEKLPRLRRIQAKG